MSHSKTECGFFSKQKEDEKQQIMDGSKLTLDQFKKPKPIGYVERNNLKSDDRNAMFYSMTRVEDEVKEPTFLIDPETGSITIADENNIKDSKLIPFTQYRDSLKPKG